MSMRIHGKEYAFVATRLVAAHGDHVRPMGITEIRTELLEVGSFQVCRATVVFTDGRAYTGMSEVSKGTGRGPQAAAPIETAETSAVGRALAFAGWLGDGSGIASAEEVIEANRRLATVQVPRSAGVAANDDDDAEDVF